MTITIAQALEVTKQASPMSHVAREEMQVHDRPILFSSPMVRAILAGNKTQTRRIVKLTEAGRVKMPGKPTNWHIDDPKCIQACPYGTPGDRLWVRETWQCEPGSPVFYRADYHDDPLGPDLELSRDGIRRKWRSAIHMPRSASRIQLEVTDVRVERLNEIGHDDALAEGVIDDAQILETQSPGRRNIAGETSGDISRRLCWPQRRYAALWESIHGPGSWDAKPWVWVVSFRRIEQEAVAA